MAVIRCEECGNQIEYDETNDCPVPHACVEKDDSGVAELDFDSDGCYFGDAEG